MDGCSIYEMCVARKWFYHLMSTAFYQKPTKEHMMPFIESNVFAALQEAGEKNIHVHALANVLEEMSTYEKADYQTLAEEYGRLFATSGKVLAPPWESVYRSKEYLLMDEHTLAVREFFQSCGYQVDDLTKGPEDHIGLELGLISNLIDESLSCEESQEVINNLHKQHAFIEDHIAQFMEPFSAQVVKNSQSIFYANLAQFMVMYIAEDLVDLDDLIQRLTNKEELTNE